MNFEQALTALREGNIVKRENWSYKCLQRLNLKFLSGNKDIIVMNGNFEPDHTDIGWFPDTEDLNATDWELVKDKEKK